MSRRSRRSATLGDSTALVAALAASRRECVVAQSQLHINGTLYGAIGVYMVALDDLAGHLTGDRERFWLKARKY